MTEKTGVVGVHDLEMREAYINLRKFADTPEGDVAIMVYARACTNAGARLGVVGVPAEPTEQVLNVLFEIANDIHGEIDKQTYDEKRAAEWDLPEDHAFDVRITQAQDHALNKAILLVEKHRAALAAPPSPLPAPVEPTADQIDAKRYRWLCEIGPTNWIYGSGSQTPGHGPYVALSIPAVYAPAGGVALESKEQIDQMIDSFLNTKRPAP